MIQISKDLTEFIKPNAHAEFSASSADAWLACPARRRLIEGIPSETSIYAEEGTLAHSVCEAIFRQEMYGIEMPVELNLKLAMLEDGGAEMIDSAYNYYNVVTGWLGDSLNIGNVLWFGLERGIPVYPKDGCYGTADCVIIGDRGAAVIDFKYGRGKAVGAASLQLKVYLTGVYLNIHNLPEDYRFSAVVVQPRTDAAQKIHYYTTEDLNSFSKDIYAAIIASKDPEAQPIEGSHCFWCPAKRTKDMDKKCPIIKEKPMKLAQEEFGKYLAKIEAAPTDMTNELSSTKERDEAMLKIMALAPIVSRMAQEIEDEFALRLEKGESIEGLMVYQEAGRRKLNADTIEEATALLTPHFPGLKVSKTVTKTTIRSLTEIEKELGKGALDPYCIKPLKKKIKLVDEKVRAVLENMRAYIE